MLEENNLTSVEDWDKNWHGYNPSLIKENDSILGEQGAFLKTIESRLILSQNDKVLELGGACSSYLCSLAKFKKIDASVIDYSKLGLEKTKELFKLNGCEVKLYHGNIFKYEFSENTFDCIVHWGLIEHFNNPKEVFEISSRILKNSGAVVFTMPNMDAYGANLWKKYDTEDFEQHVYHSDEYLYKLAKDTGFNVSSIYYWGPPLYFNAGYWFKNKFFLKFVINFFVRVVNIINRIFPLFRYGHKKISAHRAFIFIKN